MMTTFERGKLEERRETIMLVLEAKFGPLPTEIKDRSDALSAEQLRSLSLTFFNAQALSELLPDRAAMNT